MITAMSAIDFFVRFNLNPDKVTFPVRKVSTMIGGTTASLKIGEIYTIT